MNHTLKVVFYFIFSSYTLQYLVTGWLINCKVFPENIQMLCQVGNKRLTKLLTLSNDYWMENK